MEPKLITYLKTKINVTVLPEQWQIPGLWICFKPYAWWYDWNSNQLWVCTNTTWAALWTPTSNFILWHELWHFVNDEYLTELEKTQYADLWTKSMAAWKETFQREYWTTAIVEWFADDMAYILQWSFTTYIKPKQRSIRARRILLVRRIIRRLEKLLKP